MDYRPTTAALSLLLAAPLVPACEKPSPATADPTPHTATQITASAASRAAEIQDGIQSQTLVKPALEAEPEPELPWARVASFDAPIDFAPLTTGVLLSAGDQTLTLEGGELVEAPAKALKHGPPQGAWPDNAWTTKTRVEERAGLYLRMSKWKGNNRWVAQPIKDVPNDLMWEDDGRWYENYGEFWGHVGGRGGYLLAVYDWEDTITFRRLAGKNFAPIDWTWDDESNANAPLDVFEAPSGRLFVFSRDDDGTMNVDERGFCRQNCKVERHELAKLEPGAYPKASVALDDEHLAVGFAKLDSGPSTKQLAIGGEGQWIVESAPVATKVFHAYTAGASGELFAVVGFGERGDGEQLWHRDREGEWTALALPEGVGEDGARFELARADADTLWVAVNDDEDHTIYALPVALG